MRVFKKALRSISRCLEAYIKLQTGARPWALKESTGKRELGQPLMARQREKPAEGMTCTSNNPLGLGTHIFLCPILAACPGAKKTLMSPVLGQESGQGLQTVSQQVDWNHQESAVQRSLWRAGRADSPPNHPTEENLPAKIHSNQHRKHSSRRKTDTKYQQTQQEYPGRWTITA